MAASVVPLYLLSVLTACGGKGDGTGEPTVVESSDAVTGSLPRYDSTAAVRDTLAGTDWKCRNWSDADAGVASCIIVTTDGATDRADGTASIHGVYVNDHPAETASTIFRTAPDTPAVIIGNNWLFDCGPDASLGLDRCGDIAGVLGGTVVVPDPV